MQKYDLICDYKDNKIYRESFFKLAATVFQVDFRPWYEKGCWGEKFICYSYAYEEQVIANVSVNKMTFIICGAEKSAIQIGTVMTHPHFRHQGLAKSLMNHVLQLYQGTCDFIYLFANVTALDFYPAFGLERIQEYKYVLDVTGFSERTSSIQKDIRKLDVGNAADFSLMNSLAKDGISCATTIQVRDNAHLWMFYFLIALPDCIYYVMEDDTIVLMKEVAGELHLFDVISRNKQPLAPMINGIISPETKEVRFHFIPDLQNKQMRAEKLTGEDVLFVRPQQMDFGVKHPLIPLTSHA